VRRRLSVPRGRKHPKSAAEERNAEALKEREAKLNLLGAQYKDMYKKTIEIKAELDKETKWHGNQKTRIALLERKHLRSLGTGDFAG
jgi:hypothetical protein